MTHRTSSLFNAIVTQQNDCLTNFERDKFERGSCPRLSSTDLRLISYLFQLLVEPLLLELMLVLD